MAIYPRGEIYWMDRVINGRRYRESLDTPSHQVAIERQDARVAEIRQKVEIPSGETVAKGPFTEAAKAYMRSRAGEVAESTRTTETQLLKPLTRFFGQMTVRKIAVDHLRGYREQRNGISASTINQEIGLFKRILKRSGREFDLKPLRVSSEVGRVLSPSEKSYLFSLASTNRAWRRAFLAARLAAATGMRKSELRRLLWSSVDLDRGTITVTRETTKSDKGNRVIPINGKASIVLSELAELKAGDRVVPFLSWRSAWEAMTRAAGVEGFRFHDLRHQVITELAESGVADQTILELAGHVNRRMLEHYSHVRLAAKQSAMTGIG